MDNAIDNFVFKVTNALGRTSATTVYMTYETGNFFTHSDHRTPAELTDPVIFAVTRPCILLIRSRLWFSDYTGAQVVVPSMTDPRQTSGNALCRRYAQFLCETERSLPPWRGANARTGRSLRC